MFIVGIDPGHGGTNHGCTANGIHESDYTLKVGLALEKALRAIHVPCVISRREDESVSLELRARRLCGTSVVVVLHVNAAATPDARHMRCYALPGDHQAIAMGFATLQSAPELVRPPAPVVSAAVQGTDTGRPYNVLAYHAPKPALLCELFFATNPAEATFALQPGADLAFAEAVIAGIMAVAPMAEPLTQIQTEDPSCPS